VTVGSVSEAQAPGVAFRTPTFAFVATDSSDPSIVYIAYQNFVGGDYDIYVQRSTMVARRGDRRCRSMKTPAPDIKSSQRSKCPTAFCTSPGMTSAIAPRRPTKHWMFTMLLPTRQACHTGVQPQCPCDRCLPQWELSLVRGGTAAFHGDYIELDARWDGENHIVHAAWADNRDVSPCDLDPAPGRPPTTPATATRTSTPAN